MRGEFTEKNNYLETNCLIQDGSVFIGLSSLPLGKESDIENTVDKLFVEFKKLLKRKIKDYTTVDYPNSALEDLDNHFYNPKKYYLFGEFDLAMITLIDGFSFPVREFTHKSFYLNTENPLLETSRHNILGPTPKFNDENIINSYKRVFSPENQYPLISISRLKLNDLFLLEKGTDFIRGSIKLINQKLKEIRLEKDFLNFDFFIVENYGWSELTVVFFVDSYKIVGEIMLKLRSLLWQDLLNTLKDIDLELQVLLSK